MSRKTPNFTFSILIAGALLLVPGVTLAQDAPSDAVVLGALAWNNWTKIDSGGSDTLPAGVDSGDYIRCKACHGWEQRATDGGYARRSRKDSRPNAGAGDGDSTSRAITGGAITAAMITHAGTGRAYTDGKASWVALGETHSADNKAAHSNGYTLGNQHPDLSVNGLTQAQVDGLVEYLNFEDGWASAYFSNIDPSQEPVLYTIIPTADAVAGKTFYDANCLGCHGDPETDHNGANGGAPDGGLIVYLAKDGKFSEFAHKARWGSPDSIMTRASIGSPTSANIADVMLYLQELGDTGFAINTGLSGHWFNSADRNGEGFIIDVGTNAQDEVVVIGSFYSFDSMGNQAWMLGAGTADGDQVIVDLIIGENNNWGEDFVSGGTDETPFGTAVFTLTSCTAGHVAIVPNMTMEGRGFTALEYDVARDLTSHDTCPISD